MLRRWHGSKPSKQLHFATFSGKRARDFMTEPHINWGPPGFSFTRHPYDKDYQEALKRATAWWDQHYCR